MTTVYLNRIATAVPPHDIHVAFQKFAGSSWARDADEATLFWRMAKRSGIEHRYSCLAPHQAPENGAVDLDGFYHRGQFPGTRERMRKFEHHAPSLAQAAIERLDLGGGRKRITHLVMTSCTGMSAPGLDFEVIDRCGLPSHVERTFIGFMGCYAAINALKVARHIVRSEPGARVLVLNIELCTLHLHESKDLEQLLTFLLFADGCAASLVTAEPTGAALDSFRAVRLPGTSESMTWMIGDSGFDMTLSGQVPNEIQQVLQRQADEILEGAATDSVDLWAVHPGGRTVLDAAERGLGLPLGSLVHSREVLKDYGNMSSGTVMFVLERMLQTAKAGARGCAMSFGPGLVAETMLFHVAG